MPVREAARQRNVSSCGGNGCAFNMHYSFLGSGLAVKLSEQVPSNGHLNIAHVFTSDQIKFEVGDFATLVV